MHVSGREKLLLNVVFYHFLGGIGQKGNLSVSETIPLSLGKKKREQHS